MPSNTNWVCFECRLTIRRARGEVAAPLCSSCGERCVDLGHKCALPPKDNQIAWRKLRERFNRIAIEQCEQQSKDRVRRWHALEQKILSLESKPATVGRKKAIRLLREELGKL